VQPFFADHAKAMESLQPVMDQVFKTGTAQAKDAIPNAVQQANDDMKGLSTTLSQ